MLGLVNRPNDISLSRANQSQAKFKSVAGGNLLQSWVNLTIGSLAFNLVWYSGYGVGLVFSGSEVQIPE